MFSIQTEFETVLPDILIHLNFKHVYLVISGLKEFQRIFLKVAILKGGILSLLIQATYFQKYLSTVLAL